MKKTIVFDLDDTLINEIEFLKSAFKEIANNLDSRNDLLFDQMFQWHQNKENVFNKLLQVYECSIEELKNSYRSHVPNFDPISQNRQFLLDLKAQSHFLGLITDGFSLTQRKKIKALDIENIFDLIIISEEFGSEKPNLKNFEIFHKFKTENYYYIADNTSKDFVAPNQLGWQTICLLDNGFNIHKQNFDLEKLYLPKIRINELADYNFNDYE
jgi:putative hydrolase of the HAD superfamily